MELTPQKLAEHLQVMRKYGVRAGKLKSGDVEFVFELVPQLEPEDLVEASDEAQLRWTRPPLEDE